MTPLSRRLLFIALATFGAARAEDAAPASGTSSINLHAVISPETKKPEKPPAFHGAFVDEIVTVSPGEVRIAAVIQVKVVQGQPEGFTFELGGQGEVISVTGENLLDWSLRRDAAGLRLLDLRPKPGLKPGETLSVTLAGRYAPANATPVFSPLLISPVDAVSSELQLKLRRAPEVALKTRSAEGFVALVSDSPTEQRFRARGPATLTLEASLTKDASEPVSLEGFRLSGSLAGDHAGFELNAVAHVLEAGATCDILSGEAALREIPADAPYRVRVVVAGGKNVCRLEFDKPGDYPVKLAFDAAVTVRGDLRSVNFAVPAARVAPFSLSGLETGTKFESEATSPQPDGASFAGFLPPGGELALGWRPPSRAEAEARLFFSTEETTDVTVGSGLLRRNSRYKYKILQGKLDTVAFELKGEGEVLRVTGDDILGWSVANGSGSGDRRLVVKLARPRTGDYALTVETQNPLGVFPASFVPLALAPEGAVRHGGFLRVANAGAVRLEVVPGKSLAQVSPAAFPGKASADVAQAFVYRVTAAGAAYSIHADNILPEVAVSQVAVCTLGERDYTLDAELDVEVREAPLRELALRVPAGFAVANAVAPELVDHTLTPGKEGAASELRLMFGKPVFGRVLVKLRLEKNKTGEPAEWTLPALEFPGAKSVRGFVAATTAPGLRLTAGTSSGLSEIATAFFPVKNEALQQAWRVREPGWSATMKVEKLGVAVQSDVLHQYAVREGSVAESTLVNYVIVGAPLQTLRFRIPKGATNLEFAGGDIRGWKTTGDVAEVSLQRGVSGAFTLMATCELPMNPRGGEPDLSGIRPLEVQSEQGHVLVTADRPFGVESKEVSKQLTAIEPAEIPPEYRMIADAPLLAAYRYSGGDYSLRLALTPRGVGGTVSQVVDLASLTTKVSREGGCVTTCRYLVKSRGNPHLRLRIPAGLKLWTAKVDGAEVVPVTEGEDTLVPMPSTEGPDTVTSVEVRVAQDGDGGSFVTPQSPAPLAPVVSTAWKFSPDSGRALVRAGGEMAQISGGLSGDGLTDLIRHFKTRRGALAAMLIAGFAGLGLGLVRGAATPEGSKFRRFAGLTCLFLSGAGLGVGALLVASRAPVAGELMFTASILESGQAPALRLANLPAAGFAPGAFSLGVFALGAVLIAGGLVRRKPALRAAGWGAVIVAPLFMPGGLPLALGAASLFTLASLARGLPRFNRPGAAAAALAVGLCLITPGELEAKQVVVPQSEIVAGVTAAESLRQRLTLRDNLVEAEAESRLSGRAGSRFDLLSAPAVLTACKLPDGVRAASRTGADGRTVAQVVLEKDGAFVVKFSYRLAVKTGATEFVLPTGRAAADVLEVVSDKADFVFSGTGVVSVSPVAGAGSSATLVYSFSSERTLRWEPKTRDARAEKLIFYSEVANLFTPSPGVVEGVHTVRIRPAQGVVRELTLEIPAGFTVAEVSGDAVGDWRYDPESGLLHVSTESARGTPFEITVGTQAAVGALPAEVKLAPVVVRETAGGVGLVGLASADEVRFETVTPSGLSAVNTSDFPAPARTGDAAVVRRAFRYGSGAAGLSVRLAAVEPEVRVKSRQTVSVGEDRVTLNALLTAEILRAGLFRLSFEAPEGYDVESVSGGALAHWSEIRENGKRLVILHLRGRTLGEQKFAVALSGPGIAGKPRWTPPKLGFVEASRLDGDLLIVPEEGLRLHPATRDGVTQTNPGAGSAKGALAFRLLQDGYKLDFDVENATPWIKCDWLQDMTVLDGRVLGSVQFDYVVENAAVRSLRIRLPEDAEGVRVSGPLVADFVADPAKPGEWEVKLRRRAIGKIALNATFRRPGIEPGKPGVLAAAGPADANIRQGWIALRTGGRLSLRSDAPPDSLRPSEWASVPNSLRQNQPEATRTLRVVDPAFTLPLMVTTHDPAKLLAVRVKSAEVRSVLASDGRSLSSCRLELSLSEKRSLKFTLPQGARLWQVFVNNRTVSVAIDGNSLVAPVEPNPVSESPATLELVYDSGPGSLRAPGFDLPLENIVWKVGLPDGMKLADWSGSLVRRTDLEVREPALSRSPYDSEGYRRENEAVKQATKRDADALVKLGNKYRSEGNQEQAKNALSLAQSLSKSDAALNEDVRVQYGNLRTDQIEFGLNSRRNRVILNNGGNQGFAMPDALSQTSNTSMNFTTEEADRLRSANSGEDSSALRRLAERLAGLQQAGVATPEGIRTLLPGKGVELVFTKAMYNEAGGAPLSLSVNLADAQRSGTGLRLFALAAAILTVVGLSRIVRRKV